RPSDAEDERRDERRVPPYVVRKEREREREEEREHETDGSAECAADQVARRCAPDPPGDDARGRDRDVRRAEPPEDRARGSEKKDDKNLIADRRDVCDLEQRGAEIEPEEPADECCDETKDEHADNSFLSDVGPDRSAARPMKMWPQTSLDCRIDG